jgi:hypothetical protein
MVNGGNSLKGEFLFVILAIAAAVAFGEPNTRPRNVWGCQTRANVDAQAQREELIILVQLSACQLCMVYFWCRHFTVIDI